MTCSDSSPHPLSTHMFPGYEAPPERLALSEAAGSGDIARVQSLLADLPGTFTLPLPHAQYIANARLAAAKKELQAASRAGETDHIQVIIDRWKAEPSILSPEPEDLALPMIAAARGGHAGVVSILLDEGAVLNHTASKSALRTGNEAILMYETFFNHGWDVNSFENLPVLHTAIVNEELTKFLLNKGANPNLVSSRGMYTLECAASSGTVSVVSLLLERGASLENCNVLHHAVCTRNSDQRCFEMMEFLLQRGVDINGRSWKVKQEVPCRTLGGTALMSAVKKQETTTVELDLVERVKWLLEHGANPNILDAGGNKPIDYAVDERLVGVLRAAATAT